MTVSLKEYSGVILDATFFVKPFPQKLVSQFRDAKFLVPLTYNARVRQNRQLLGKEQLAILNNNLKLLEPFRDQMSMMPRRCPDLITNLKIRSEKAKETGERYLLITADQLSIQQVVLNGMRLDVFDLNQEVLLVWQDYEAIRATGNWDFRDSEDPVIPITLRKTPTRVVYGEDGREIQVEPKAIAKGGEAKLHLMKAPEEGKIAKLFRDGHLTQGKQANVTNLQAMQLQKVQQWAIMPQERLYWDAQRTQLAGFSQRYEKDARENLLHNNSLFCTDDDNWYKVAQEVTPGWTLKVAACLTRQVCYLNVYGIYVSDFTSTNFAADAQGSDRVLMWDADSFCFGDYFSNTADQSQIGAIRHVQRAPGQKLSVIDMCTERLYAKIFWILTLGASPLTAQGTFTNPEHHRIFVPDNLWAFFEDVFVKHHLPSPDRLLHELMVALDEWEAMKSKPTYAEVWKNKGYRKASAAEKAKQEKKTGEQKKPPVRNRIVSEDPAGDPAVVSRRQSAHQRAERPAYQFTDETDYFAMPRLMHVRIPGIQRPDTCVLGKPQYKKNRVSYRRARIVAERPATNMFEKMTSTSVENQPPGLYVPQWVVYTAVLLLAVCLGWWMKTMAASELAGQLQTVGGQIGGVVQSAWDAGVNTLTEFIKSGIQWLLERGTAGG